MGGSRLPGHSLPLSSASDGAGRPSAGGLGGVRFAGRNHGYSYILPARPGLTPAALPCSPIPPLERPGRGSLGGTFPAFPRGRGQGVELGVAR